MFYLYGASRDNDRVVHGVMIEKYRKKYQRGVHLEYEAPTRQLNLQFDYGISSTSGYTAIQSATWTTTHGILRYTRGDVSLE